MINKNFMTGTKIAGVTHTNDKGESIQQILPTLKPEDRLICIRDYNNRYDPNAIKVYTRDGRHIGYISAELASKITPFLEENPVFDLEGVVQEVTGGKNGDFYGCNILIWIQDPDEPSYEEYHSFAKSTLDPPPTTYSASSPKKQSFSWGLFAITMIIILFVIGTIGSYSQENSKKVIDDDLITLNEFNRLRTGMSRSEVYDIIGSSGTKVSEAGQIGDDRIVMYEYEGYGEVGANALLTFINGELDSMAQAGLESWYGDTSKIEVSSTDIFSHDSPVKISDLQFSFHILSPNSIGTVYAEATYSNHSQYTITFISLKVLLKDQNKNTYFICANTIMPGETSPIFQSFGPNTLQESDMELLECEITVIGEDGNKIFIDYDYKLDTYRVL